MKIATSISGSTVNISGLHSPQEAAVLANIVKNTMSFFSFDNFHKLSLGDLLILSGMGHDADELKQLEQSFGITSFKADGKKISAKRAREILGDKDFLSGLSRSTFHWTSAREADGITVSFDSSKLFK